MAKLRKATKILAILLIIILIIGYCILRFIVWPRVDADMNPVRAHKPFKISETARALHDQLWIADLHADNLLWRRDPRKRHGFGYVDLPRLAEGGVELQVFSAATKSPKGFNFDKNSAEAPDQITTLEIKLRHLRRLNSGLPRLGVQFMSAPFIKQNDYKYLNVKAIFILFARQVTWKKQIGF